MVIMHDAQTHLSKLGKESLEGEEIYRFYYIRKHPARNRRRIQGRGGDRTQAVGQDHVGPPGLEVDVIAEKGDNLMPIEIKNGATFAEDWQNTLAERLAVAGDDAVSPTVYDIRFSTG